MYAHEFPLWAATHDTHQHDLPAVDWRTSRLAAAVRTVLRALRVPAIRS